MRGHWLYNTYSCLPSAEKEFLPRTLSFHFSKCFLQKQCSSFPPCRVPRPNLAIKPNLCARALSRRRRGCGHWVSTCVVNEPPGGGPTALSGLQTSPVCLVQPKGLSGVPCFSGTNIPITVQLAFNRLINYFVRLSLVLQLLFSTN